MKSDNRDPAPPSWDAVLLVCKACRKRRNGPKELKSRRVVAEARQALRHMKPRPRVVLSSCLGLCPKAALAIALVGGPREARIAAVASLAEVERVVPLLSGRKA